MKITSTLIRAAGTDCKDADMVMAVIKACLPTIADAIEIADMSAKGDVESFCVPRGGGWYDSTEIAPDEVGVESWVKRSIRYLDARGILEHKQGSPHIIKVK